VLARWELRAPIYPYLLSKTRTRAIALAQDLIENQARIVTSGKQGDSDKGIYSFKIFNNINNHYQNDIPLYKVRLRLVALVNFTISASLG